VSDCRDLERCIERLGWFLTGLALVLAIVAIGIGLFVV
jgi:uncharacterized membrane protein